MSQLTSPPAQIVADTIIPSVRVCGSGGFAPRFVCPVAVALVRYAARRTQKDRPAWLQRSVAPPRTGICPPTGPSPLLQRGAGTHGRTGDRRAQAQPYRRRGRRTRPAAEHEDARNDDRGPSGAAALG